MKLVKMSLAAAVLLGASAFAMDNVKVSGDAKLFYSTSDDAATFGNNADLFSASSTGTAGNAAVRVGATADLTKGVSAGATVYAITTLGLENNLVSNVWEAGTAANVLADNWWMGELWMAGTVGKTTVKVGRMELDTPLAFTEKWSIVPNTFEAGVLINQDLPDTTLVAAYVGKSNGSATAAGAGIGGVTNGDKDFRSFYTGAYAFAVVNNSIKPVTFQAWYYDVDGVAKAYWLQADWDCQLAKGVKLGAQYTDFDHVNPAVNEASSYALKAAYTGVPGLMVSAAYSDVDTGTGLNANIATANGQSKLYTESWWTFGKVGAAGAQSFNLTGEYDAGIAKVGAYYTNVNGATVAGDLDEVALTASKSFGPLDATLAYISTENGAAPQANTVQAYLTLNF